MSLSNLTSINRRWLRVSERFFGSVLVNAVRDGEAASAEASLSFRHDSGGSGVISRSDALSPASGSGMVAGFRLEEPPESGIGAWEFGSDIDSDTSSYHASVFI
jgi:hypothetical protein